MAHMIGDEELLQLPSEDIVKVGYDHEEKSEDISIRHHGHGIYTPFAYDGESVLNTACTCSSILHLLRLSNII